MFDPHILSIQFVKPNYLVAILIVFLFFIDHIGNEVESITATCLATSRGLKDLWRKVNRDMHLNVKLNICLNLYRITIVSKQAADILQ